METRFAFEADGLADRDDFHRKGFAARLAKVIQQHPPGECIVVSLIPRSVKNGSCPQPEIAFT